MYHILIVDEEEHLLWALERNLFPDRQDIQVHTATSGEVGLERLGSKPIDLLVCDIKMPGSVDGFQLILRAKEVAPDARVIIITAFGTHRIQNFAERIGITHYIEKPFNVSELREAILEILDEKEGFQGVLSDLELTDIIQMLCLAKRTALLHLKHRDHRGRIVFERGEVVHADFNDVTGAEAVYHMLVLRQGDIFMQSDFDEDRRTIDMGWQDLLLEGVRRADEHRMEADEAQQKPAAQAASATERANRSMTPLGVGVAGMLENELSSAWSETSEASEAAPKTVAIEEAEDPGLMLFSEAEILEMASEGELEVAPAPSTTQTMAAVSERPASGAFSAIITAARPFDSGDSEEFEAFAAPTLGGGRREVPSAAMPSANGFRKALNFFAGKCPGLRHTGFISPDEGLAVEFVHMPALKHLDEQAVAAYFSEIVTRAHQTVRALHASDGLQEMQIALDDEYILLRAVENTPYFHLAIIEKKASLGIALVLMRQLGLEIETTLA
ncbi:MAG: DUF4388 domain-containing protein [Bradymonadaceae bacterium]|nr:DUF4388 domain-containing protein [Lujinxingiaceae bacterium]